MINVGCYLCFIIYAVEAVRLGGGGRRAASVQPMSYSGSSGSSSCYNSSMRSRHVSGAGLSGYTSGSSSGYMSGSSSGYTSGYSSGGLNSSSYISSSSYGSSIGSSGGIRRMSYLDGFGEWYSLINCSPLGINQSAVF